MSAVYLRLLVAFQVLVSAECLCAAGVIALAHGTTNNVHAGLRLARSDGCGALPLGGPDLSALQLAGFALRFVKHHLALHAVAVWRRGALVLHGVVSHG